MEYTDEKRVIRPEWEELEDETLINMIRSGNEDSADAMDFLLERYKDLVRVKTRPYFILGADRADLIQEGMIGLYKATLNYDSGKGAAFRTHAEQCIMGQIITAVKSASRMKHWPLNSYVSLNKTINDEEEKETTMMEILIAPGNTTPEDQIIDREDAIALQDAIDERCSKFEHKVLSMYLNGYDYHQIAAAMGKTPKSIDNALQRIKKKVQQIVSEVEG